METRSHRKRACNSQSQPLPQREPRRAPVEVEVEAHSLDAPLSQPPCTLTTHTLSILNSPHISPNCSPPPCPPLSPRSATINLEKAAIDVEGFSIDCTRNPQSPHASPDGSVPTSTPEQTLLQLRKEYHHLNQYLVKAQHHYHFLTECYDNNITPNGLRIVNEPHILLGKLSPLPELFKCTIRETEVKLTMIVIAHYELLIPALEKDIQDIDDEMATILRNLPTEEIDHHTTIITKTESNIKRTSDTLKEKGKKKMESLHNPGSKRGPPHRRPRPARPHHKAQLPQRAPQPPKKLSPHTTTHQIPPTHQLPPYNQQRPPLLPTPQLIPTIHPTHYYIQPPLPQGPPPPLPHPPQGLLPHPPLPPQRTHPTPHPTPYPSPYTAYYPHPHFHSQPHLPQGFPPPPLQHPKEEIFRTLVQLISYL